MGKKREVAQTQWPWGGYVSGASKRVEMTKRVGSGRVCIVVVVGEKQDDSPVRGGSGSGGGGPEG